MFTHGQRKQGRVDVSLDWWQGKICDSPLRSAISSNWETGTKAVLFLIPLHPESSLCFFTHCKLQKHEGVTWSMKELSLVKGHKSGQNHFSFAVLNSLQPSLTPVTANQEFFFFYFGHTDNEGKPKKWPQEAVTDEMHTTKTTLYRWNIFDWHMIQQRSLCFHKRLNEGGGVHKKIQSMSEKM